MATRVNQHVSGRLTDVVLAWGWLGIAIAVWGLRSSPSALVAMADVAFVISFAHQPLTLLLVYGDQRQRRSRRWLFTLSPAVAVVIVIVMWLLAPVVLAVVGLIWNAQHTLMQRYGLLRVYGRKKGDDQAKLERQIIWSLFGATASSILVFHSPTEISQQLGLGRTNRGAVEVASTVAPVASGVFIVCAGISIVLIGQWLLVERSGGGSAWKYSFAAGTLGLAMLVMIDPIIGLIAYISGHSIEYFLVVRSSLNRRVDNSWITAITRSGTQQAKLMLFYALSIFLIIQVSHMVQGGYAIVIFVLGALHIFYDGMIWKLRRPSVAQQFGVQLATTLNAVR